MTAMIDITNAEKTYHAPAGRRRAAGGARRLVPRRTGERGAVGAVRRRQILDPEDDSAITAAMAAGSASAIRAVIDLATAEPRQVLSVRRSTIGYVSQFLRAVPRVATIDVVAEP